MLLLRFLLIIAALALVFSVGLYFLTRNQKYLRFAWQLVRLVVLCAFPAISLWLPGFVQ